MNAVTSFLKTLNHAARALRGRCLSEGKSTAIIYATTPANSPARNNCVLVGDSLDGVAKGEVRGVAIAGVVRVLQGVCSLKCPFHKDKPPLFSAGFLKKLADKSKTSARVEGNQVFSEDAWGLRHGNKARALGLMLKLVGQPMRLSEVTSEYRRMHPEDATYSPRNVTACLDRAPGVIALGRKRFVHVDAANIPPGLLDDIEKWLVERLKHRLPFVSVHLAYDKFRELSGTGITTELGLYNCLRGVSSELALPRYPQIYWKPTFESRTPTAIVVENYVREAGETVPFQALKAFVEEGLGMKRFQLQQILSQLSRVFRTADGGFIHVDHLALNKKGLGDVLAHVKMLVAREGRISLQKVLEEKSVTCATAGIEDAGLLYSVLEALADEELVFQGSPYVAHSELGPGDRTIGAEVARYLSCANRVCSFEELEDKFVDSKGYNPRTVYAVVNRGDVCRYGQGTIVHHSAIGWTLEKQTRIEKRADSVLKSALAGGKGYGLVSDILEFCDVPALEARIDWTLSLLSELLEASGSYRVLGPTKNVFVGNDLETRTFQDLLAKIVETKFEGAVELDELEALLRLEQIIESKLTLAQIETGGKLRVIGATVMLEGLLHRA